MTFQFQKWTVIAESIISLFPSTRFQNFCPNILNIGKKNRPNKQIQKKNIPLPRKLQIFVIINDNATKILNSLTIQPTHLDFTWLISSDFPTEMRYVILHFHDERVIFPSCFPFSLELSSHFMKRTYVYISRIPRKTRNRGEEVRTKTGLFSMRSR